MEYAFVGQGVCVGADGAPKLNGHVAILEEVPPSQRSLPHRCGVAVRGYYTLAGMDWPLCMRFCSDLCSAALSRFSTTWAIKWCDCMQVALEWCSAACDAQVSCKAFAHKRVRAVGVCKLHDPMLGLAYPSHQASLQCAADIWKRSVFRTWQVRQIFAHLLTTSKPSHAESPPPPCREARAEQRAFRIKPPCSRSLRV